MQDEAAAAAAADASLEAIEWRTRAVLHGLERAIAALTSTAAAVEEAGPSPLSAEDLDLARASWQPLVPADPVVRALLLRRLLDRCGVPARALPGLAAALGFDDPEVEQAFAARYGESLARAAERAPVRRSTRRVALATDDGRKRLLALERSFTRLELEASEVLFRAGDPADSLYVVVTGRVSVLVGEPDAERKLTELEGGEIVGELSLLAGERRSATIVAVRDSELYRLDAEAIERHLLTEPVVVRSIMATLARRVRASSGAAAPRPTLRGLALVPAGSTPASAVAAFAARFANVLASSCRVVLVDRAAAEVALGTGGLAGGSGRSRWLGELEETHDLVLYDASGAAPCAASDDEGASDRSEAGEWARLCVRQADLVLLVGLDEASADLGPLEDVVGVRSSGQPPRQLVVLHRPGREPSPSAAWRAGREIERVHHVVAEDPSHLGRLARLLLGRPVGLVLSGGGLRGFAHVGLARALQEHGVPIDIVCGTSSGALVGAALAMGWSAGELERRSRQHFDVPRRRLLDVTLPVTSFVGGTHLNRILGEIFGDRQIEDLWLPFYCTVTDLTTTELITLDAGSFRDAVRASCAFPALFPPVVADGHLLADGGILNNLPVFPLLERVVVGTVVACNVATPFYTADEAYNYHDSLPWWRVLNARLNPLASRLVVPSITKVLMRSLEVGTKSLERAQADRAELYVRPTFLGLSDFDPKQLPAFIRCGYEAACRALDGFEATGIPFR